MGSLCLWGAILLGACGPQTQVEKAGSDQEIARNINWDLRKDSRFVDVIAKCVDKVVTLEGRVDDQPAAQEAVRIAAAHARGARFVLNLVVRPR